MAGIFISHSAADKRIVDAFVDNIIRLGCGVPAGSIFYSSGAGTGVPAGSDLNAYIREVVRDVKLVVAFITPSFQTRPFCIAELGAAWSQVGNLFPLAAPEVGSDDLKGVLSGMLVRQIDDGSALDELHDRIQEVSENTTSTAIWSDAKSKWLDAVEALRAPTVEHPLPTPTGPAPPDKGSKQWGQLFDSFVDAALYTADDSVGRDEILRAAELSTLIPGRYLYSSDSGADNWVRLCRDPMYRHHQESVEYWANAEGRKMASLIKEKLGRDDFDYVSLGSGDGQKDADLVACWLESGSDIFYYPYDISLPLVSRAIRAVRDKAPHETTHRLRIKAVLADFNHLRTVSEVFTHRNSPNVVTLLGNSLGNLEHELRFLRDLRREMSVDDLLVLEVRLKSDDGTLPELATPQALRFDFGPLEHYLGLVFDKEKMNVKREKLLSSIPNTTTTIVTCDGIDVRNSHYPEAKLIYIHEYEEQAFVTALKENYFDIVELKPGTEDERFLVCVLRKRVVDRDQAN